MVGGVGGGRAVHSWCLQLNGTARPFNGEGDSSCNCTPYRDRGPNQDRVRVSRHALAGPPPAKRFRARRRVCRAWPITARVSPPLGGGGELRSPDLRIPLC